MTTRDLRIGDKVVYDGVVHEIIQLNNLSVRILRNGYGRLVLSEELEPIPITDDLLEELYFDRYGTDTDKYIIYCQTIKMKDGIEYNFNITYHYGKYKCGCNEFLLDKKITYLHELQHVLWDAKIEINTINDYGRK